MYKSHTNFYRKIDSAIKMYEKLIFYETNIFIKALRKIYTFRTYS